MLAKNWFKPYMEPIPELEPLEPTTKQQQQLLTLEEQQDLWLKTKIKKAKNVRIGLKFQHYRNLLEPLEKMMRAKCNFMSIYMDSPTHFEELVKSNTENFEIDTDNYWPVNPRVNELDMDAPLKLEYDREEAAEVMENVNVWNELIVGVFPIIHEKLTELVVSNAVKLYKHQLDYYSSNFQIATFMIEPQVMNEDMTSIIRSLKLEIRRKTRNPGRYFHLVVNLNMTSTDAPIKWFSTKVQCKLIRQHNPLVPAVTIGKDKPSEELLTEWKSIMPSFVIIPTDIFTILTSKEDKDWFGNYPPYLDAEYQHIVIELMCARARPIIDPKGNEDINLRPYYDYIRYIYTEYWKGGDANELWDLDKEFSKLTFEDYW